MTNEHVLEDVQSNVVARDVVGDYYVSTVDISRISDPMLGFINAMLGYECSDDYETMVFDNLDGGEGWIELLRITSDSEEDALRIHNETVAGIAAGTMPEIDADEPCTVTCTYRPPYAL